jgi:hypothetical protein
MNRGWEKIGGLGMLVPMSSSKTPNNPMIDVKDGHLV